MPSFLEREQIQPIQPYISDAGSILNTFNTKLQYWVAGASQVKTAYDRYLGLDLTNQSNIDDLNSKMKTAKSQMQQVIQTDLSVGDNQAMAQSIFDPITKDPNIMGDNEITKFYKDQYQLGEAAKTVDGGKNYNANNQNILLTRLNRFRNDSADNWQQHWAQRKGYTPYYDTHKEDLDLTAKFKPSIMDSQMHYSKPVYKTDANGNTLQGNDGKPQVDHYEDTMYMMHTKDQSWYAPQLKLFLEANHSDKYKEQKSIDGIMSYGDDTKAIAQDYLPYAQDNMAISNGRISTLQGQLAATNDPTQKALINVQIGDLRNRAQSLAGDIKNISSGNLSFINQNKDRYASYLYEDKANTQLAASWAHTDLTQKLLPDEVSITQFVQGHEDYRNQQTINKDLQIRSMADQSALDVESYKLYGVLYGKDKKNGILGPGETGQSFLPPATDVNEVKDDKTTFENDLNESKSSLQNAQVSIWKYITTSKATEMAGLNGDARIAYAAAYFKQQAALPAERQEQAYKDYMETSAQLTTDIAMKQLSQNYINKTLTDKYPGLGKDFNEIESKVDRQAPSGVFSDPVVRKKVVRAVTEMAMQADKSKVFDLEGNKQILNYFNSHKVEFHLNESAIDDVSSLYEYAKSNLNDRLKAYNTDEQKLYGAHNISQFYWQTINNQELPQVKQIKDRIAGNAGIDKDYIGNLSYDGKGHIAVNLVTPKDKNATTVDANDIATKLTGMQQYGNVTVRGDKTNPVLLLNTNELNVQTNKFPIQDNFDKYLNVLIKDNNNGVTPSGMWAPRGQGRYFRINAYKSPNTGQILYTPVMEDPDNAGRSYTMNDKQSTDLTTVMNIADQVAGYPELQYRAALGLYSVVKLTPQQIAQLKATSK